MALNAELLDLYERSRVKPWKGLVVVGATLLVEGLLGAIALGDPQRRGLSDQIAKTVVVEAN